MLVSFSGLDSSGKTTQITLLEKYCAEHGISAKRVWGKARGTPGVVFLKELVRRDKGMSQEEKLEYRECFFENPKKKKLLLIASLLDLIWFWGIYYRIEGIRNNILILDRYLWDTYVEIKTEFKGIVFEKWLLWKILVLVTPKPKISFLFVIPAEESIRRDVQKEDLTVDSIELKREKISLYMHLKNQGKWSTIMDGMKSIQELHKEVVSVLKI